MGIMRSFVPLVLLALVASPARAEYVKYADLRAENPSIDEAIAALSSSDLHGTFNRISAILQRGQVRDLPAGTLDSDLPANVTRNLQNALSDLGADLAAADADLAASGLSDTLKLRYRWVLAQTVAYVFTERVLELSDVIDPDTGGAVTCEASVYGVNCPYDDDNRTPTLDVFRDELLYDADDGFAKRALARWMDDVLQNAQDAGDTVSFSTNVGLDPRDFFTRLEELQGTAPLLDDIGPLSIVHGEPIIDD